MGQLRSARNLCWDELLRPGAVTSAKGYTGRNNFSSCFADCFKEETRL